MYVARFWVGGTYQCLGLTDLGSDREWRGGPAGGWDTRT